jgi:hypothetical protein
VAIRVAIPEAIFWYGGTPTAPPVH